MDKLSLLSSKLQELESAVVAFSGGVDSSLLLAVARKVLGDRVLAVTATSELMSDNEIKETQVIADDLKVQHLLIPVSDLENHDFTLNTPERCYHCKKFRFQLLTDLSRKHGYNWVVEGSNTDDLLDYRPGHKAIKELGVRSPLQEVGLTKKEIRDYAKSLGLTTWNKPSKPCLATRIPYGTPITASALRRVGEAEKYLISLLGYQQIRVREHGPLARLELTHEALPLVLEPETARAIQEELRKIGYTYVALDILGYRQGSMNEALG